ncbi:MAG: hypothetical protein QOH06_3095 [Acidobacteriota bacterium]|jgi:hypothetical protein|nr:hypothetical protein [Acidobacteriota bacterium]
MASYDDFKKPLGWKVIQLGVSSTNPWSLSKGPTPDPDILWFEGDGTTTSPGRIKKNSDTTPIGINCVFTLPNIVDVRHNVSGGKTYRITLTDNTPPTKDTLNCRQHPSGGAAWTTLEGG